MMNIEKLNALLGMLINDGETEVENINSCSCDNNLIEIEVDGEDREYLVLDEYEAKQYFHDRIESLFDDMGLEAFSERAQEYILENCIDTNYLSESIRESYEFYVEDIEDEEASNDEFENRLEEEIREASCQDKEDYIDYLCEEYKGCEAQYFINNFGSDQFKEMILNNDLIDIDKVVEYIDSWDGRGNIVSYDGEEIEESGYYIYRMD